MYADECGLWMWKNGENEVLIKDLEYNFSCWLNGKLKQCVRSILTQGLRRGPKTGCRLVTNCVPNLVRESQCCKKELRGLYIDDS